MRFLVVALVAILGLAPAAAQFRSADIPVAADAQGAKLPTLAPVLRQVAPSVVSIRATAQRVPEETAVLNSLFPLLFGIPVPAQEEEIRTAGSGVIVDATQGLIVTNSHVVKGAEEIAVTLADGTRLVAEVIALDPATDLAVVKVPAGNLAALPLADSDALQVGDFVITVGNPFGIGQAANFGIVSGLHRAELGVNAYEDFIQTDAPINVGDSGGALVDLGGNLVGITTIMLERGGANTSIGFAIPANMVRALIAQMIAHGDIRRGQIGIRAKDVAEERARQMRRAGIHPGAELASVEAGSSAAKAGLKIGDIITAVDGVPIRDAADLRNRLALIREGKAIGLSALRENRAMTVGATMDPVVAKRIDGQLLDPSLQGVGFRFVEPLVLTELVEIEVDFVAAGSQAWKAGLRAGDIVLAVNHETVDGPETFTGLVKANQARLMFELWRDGRSLFAVIR